MESGTIPSTLNTGGRVSADLRNWLLVSAAILLAETAAVWFLAKLGEARYGQDWTYFKEGQPGTFLSALNLGACALVSLLVFRGLRGTHFSRFWLVMTALFFLAAADEIFRLHESLSHAASRVFGYRRRHQTLRHLDDVLVAIYGLVAIVAAGLHWRDLLKLRGTVAFWSLAGALFAGMVAMDLLRWSYALEDSLKILAGAAILCGVLYPLMVRSSVIPSPCRSPMHQDSCP